MFVASPEWLGNSLERDIKIGDLMDTKNLSRVSGALWIFSVVTVFIALIITIANNITLMDKDIVQTLRNINANELAHILELVFDVVSSTTLIVVAVTTFLVLKTSGITAAAIGSILLAVGGTILVVHDMGNFALTWLAREYAVAPAANAPALESMGRAMIYTAKWGVTLGAIHIVMGVLFYSVLLYASNLSRMLGILGIISSILALIATVPAWINPAWEQLGYNLFFPFMIWEIAFAVWLLRAKFVA